MSKLLEVQVEMMGGGKNVGEGGDEVAEEKRK